ncbi:hypothetical protein [Peribacillus loiseleuriae]|uniref:hypothetical protein n=1 Tax=Peribacillus loiseleuriae TaxID=1679170 RepID=UPI003D073CB5
MAYDILNKELFFSNKNGRPIVLEKMKEKPVLDNLHWGMGRLYMLDQDIDQEWLLLITEAKK